MDGIYSWCLSIMINCLPSILQAALVILDSGLSYYFFLNQTVAGVVIGFTSFCLFLYTAYSLAATFYRHCLYQIPLTFVLRRFVHRWLSEGRRSHPRTPKPHPSHSKSRDRDPLLPMWTPKRTLILFSNTGRRIGMVMWCTPIASPGCWGN